MCVCVCIYIHIHTGLMYIQVYIYIHAHTQIYIYIYTQSFPSGEVVKNLPANDAGDARNMDSVPGSGISPAAGNGKIHMHTSSILYTHIQGTLYLR